jgi:hypothetical protein
MSDAAWDDYICVHDLKESVLPFDVGARNRELEEKRRTQEAQSKMFWKTVTAAGVTAVLCFLLIIAMIVYTAAKSGGGL